MKRKHKHSNKYLIKYIQQKIKELRNRGKISNRKLLTRDEMWEAITSKYESLKAFRIDCKFKEWSNYIRRDELFFIILEMKIHKSRHLTKKQKQKVFYELEQKILNKTVEKI